MILGTSAFVYREEGTNRFFSKGLIEDKKIQPIHTDVSFVNASDELDIEAFKNWREEFKEAEFISEEDGTFKVSREVEKMSKSKYNVVNPDNICAEYGADSLRLFEMFLGPLEQAKPWKTSGISGVHSFLIRTSKTLENFGYFWSSFFLKKTLEVIYSFYRWVAERSRSETHQRRVENLAQNY